jgi:imidazolonepropionase-like amidohydrolase
VRFKSAASSNESRSRMRRELTKCDPCNPADRAPRLRGALYSRALLRCLAVVFPALSPFAVASPPQATPLPDPYPSTYHALPRTDTLINNATVLDGLGHRFTNASVLLHEGKILAVGPNLGAPQGVKTIDAHGGFVTPGLIDVHSHLGDFAAPFTLQDAKVSDVNEESSPNSAEVWALHSIRVQDPQFARVRAGGVTTLQVLPGSSDLFGGRGVVLKNVPAVTVQEMEFPGAMPSLKMACGENPKYTFGEKGEFPSSEMGNVAGYRQAWIEAGEYKRRWDDYYAKHDPNLQPPIRDLKLETLAAVLRGQILVDMHCYRADEMAVMMDVAKEFGYKITAFHHAVEAYKIVPLLRKNDVCVAVWADWWGYKVEAYDAVRANAAFVDAGGGCVMLHSDAPISGERLTLDAALAMGAGHRAGVDIPEERAIEWLTINPARSLHLEGQIGSLEPGKNADVVVWSGDPFSVYTRASIVFIDGAIVYDRNDPARQATSDFEVGQPARERPQ